MTARYRILKSSGFSLVEMLVVVAIIAILASLMLPALQNAVRSAYTTACLNNLRHAGMLDRIYSENNYGILLPHRQNRPGGGHIYHAEILSGLAGQPFNLRTGIWCNSAAATDANSYGNNIYVHADISGGNSPWRISNFKTPGRVFSRADQHIDTLVSAFTQDRFAFRHSGSLNILYLDGRASWYERMLEPASNYIPYQDTATWQGTIFWNRL